MYTELDILDTTMLPSKEIRALASQKSVFILSKIIEINKQIIACQKLIENNKESISDLIPISHKKKEAATKEAVIKSNALAYDLNVLIQEAITFECTSIQMARVMSDTIEKILTEGFSDADGNTIILSKELQFFARMIVEEGKSFTKKQLEVSSWQSEDTSKGVTEEQKLAQKEQKLLESNNRLKIIKEKFSIIEIELDKAKTDQIVNLQKDRLDSVLKILNNNELMKADGATECIRILCEYVKQQTSLTEMLSKKIERKQKGYTPVNMIISGIAGISLIVSIISIIFAVSL